jgi:multiple sugar transport system permease protein
MKDTSSTIKGYLFFLPFLVAFVLVRLAPLGHSIWLTFHEWEVLTPPVFVGLKNYRTLFMEPRFWKSITNTFYFTVLTVPPLVALGFGLANVVNGPIYGKSVFRALFFVPYILSISVICITWMLLLNRSYGVVNSLLESLGFQRVGWLSDPSVAMISIGLTTIWWTFGFNFLIYLAAMQQIPASLYEAAQMDGARRYHTLFFITIPILRRTHAIVIVLQLLASLQIFGQVYIMTGGGPGGHTRVIIQYIYEEGFRYFNMGYAQAVAIVFFLFMLGIAYLQIRLSMAKEDM